MTLPPSAGAMEERGLVTSWWDTASRGPARRTYDLTPLGHDRLESQAAPPAADAGS